MKKLKLPFNRIWLLVTGIILSALILSYGNAQYQAETDNQTSNQADKLIAAEIVSDTELNTNSDQENSNNATTQDSSSVQSQSNQTTSETTTVTNQESNTNENNSTTNNSTSNTVTNTVTNQTAEVVNLNINSVGSYQVEFESGDTGWSVMQRAASKYKFAMTYQVFDFGIYIISIGGIEPGYGSYWSLYHNGAYSMVGIRDLVVSPNDTITWQVESWL